MGKGLSPIILFRKSVDSEAECLTAKQYLDVAHNRTECRNSLVVGRYSVLPYYKELEEDLKNNGSELINSYWEHNWIADFSYYYELEQYTPKTWFQMSDVPNNAGPLVLKGRTNSRKYAWNDCMFAEDKQAAMKVYCKLMEDYMIGTQGVVIRQYEPLKKLGQSVASGVPWSNEWRFFFLGKQLLAYGFYWSSADEECIKQARMNGDGLRFAQNVANIASEFTNFFVLDIAEKENGEWILIEMNDGQMSGLSEIDPELFYSTLDRELEKWV